MAMPTKVYLISDDRGRPRYVGTSIDPARRVRGHIAAGRKQGRRIGWWLRAAERACRAWTLKTVAEYGNRYLAEAAEKALIKRLVASGAKLINVHQTDKAGIRIRRRSWIKTHWLPGTVRRDGRRKTDDGERFANVMQAVTGRRVTWRQLTAQDGCGFMGLQ